MSDQQEVPWPSGPVNAKLAREGIQPSDIFFGWIHFKDPSDRMAKAAVPVTRGPQTQFKPQGSEQGTPIWHIDCSDDPQPGDIVTVSPSIHFVGYWHSPSPVQFRLVEELS